jgi:inorganic pyrophosphatase
MLSKEENQALPVFGFGIHVCRNLYLVFLSFGMISVVDCDPRYDNVRELSDLPRFILDEISNFFQNYKVLQGVHVTTGDYHSKEETLTVIEECRQRYIDSLK